MLTGRAAFRRKNHYLAQHYLKRWADDGRVWTYRTVVSNSSVPAWKRQSVKGVAYHEHLYARVEHGDESDTVERWLSTEVDEPSAQVLDRVACDARLSPDDWSVLVRFFAAMQVRTPAYFLRRMPRMEKELPGLITETLKKTVAKIEAGIPPKADKSQHTFSGNLELPIRVRTRKKPSGGGVLEAQVLAGRKLWMYEMERTIVYTARHLRPLNWTILRPPQGMHWLTSDDPVVRALGDDNGLVTLEAGWKQPGAVLLLPLDPYHLMYVVVGARCPQKYSTMPVETAMTVNEITVRHAHRMVFAAERVDWVATARPRQVDPNAFEHERAEWAKYNELQSRAEHEMENESTWPT